MSSRRDVPSRPRHHAQLVALAAAMLATLAACSSAGRPVSPASHSRSPSASSTVSPSASASPARAPIAPLTGLATSATTARRPAMAVVVDGRAGGSAPVGLDQADLVYAEYAESGTVRLITVFQSHAAARVGPVTSTRPADPKLLAVLRGCLAYDGGSSGFVKQVAAAKLCQVTPVSAPSAFTGTVGARYAEVSSLYAADGGAKTPPPATSAFAASGQALGAGSKQVRQLTVSLAGRGAVTWTYDPSARRWRSVVDGTTVAVTTVQVLVMPYKSVPVHHPAGAISTAAVIGHGTATVVSGSTGVAGSWYRPSSSAISNVVDAAQHLIHPQAGSTWVILAPTGSTVRLG